VGKGNGKEIPFGDGGGSSRQEEGSQSGSRSDVIQNDRLYYAGSIRSKASVDGRRGARKYESELKMYERREMKNGAIDGPIQRIIKGVKGADNTSGKNNRYRAEFEKQGGRDVGGEQGVLDLEGVKYVGESSEAVYVSGDQHRGNLAFDLEGQRQWDEQREEPLNPDALHQYNGLWTDEHGQHQYNDLWDEYSQPNTQGVEMRQPAAGSYSRTVGGEGEFGYLQGDDMSQMVSIPLDSTHNNAAPHLDQREQGGYGYHQWPPIANQRYYE
jgi:hypothetical protein